MIEGQTLRVGGRLLPGKAIARVDKSGIFLHPEEAWGKVATNGGATPVDGSGHVDGIGATSTGTPCLNAREQGQILIPLAEERPTVTHRPVDLGEIIVVKRTVEEERLIPVRVRREVVELVRRASDGTETVGILGDRPMG